MEIDSFPEKSGIYIMKNKNKIIYVGKAKNLKKRVSSYFNRVHQNEKTNELVKNIDDIEYIICSSELEALILENNLIKENQPKYNILLKDKKTYPYLKISTEEFPKLSITRNTKDLDGEIYGPYPFGGTYLKKILLKLFQVRDCSRDMEKTYEKPCLKYYMKTCLGPCKYKNIYEEYSSRVNDLRSVLKGKGKGLLKDLDKKMKESAENMEFEKAIIYREQLEQLKHTLDNQIIDSIKGIEEDIFYPMIYGDRIFIYVLNIRDGKIIGNNSLNLKLDEFLVENEDEIYMEVLINYYSKYLKPKEIITYNIYENKENLIEEFFKKTSNEQIKIKIPKIGRKKDLLNMTFENILEYIDKYYRAEKIIEEGLNLLYQELSLKNFPTKIECFDISNIQGKDAVGSMSVCILGKKSPKNYRKFKIRSKDTPDDFHMMKEVIERRYSKISEKDLPQAILIDGGLGQINSAGIILKELNLIDRIDLLSLAKKDELIYKYGENIPYKLERSQEALKILQRLRDEAHRFGITYHRNLRSKRVISSQLDEIKGIGEKRKIELLKKFKSIDRIKSATIEELKEILPEKVAMELLKNLQ
ncbi:MAG: excinuclease ABC subunit UvrC [Cetobacterium sp.]